MARKNAHEKQTQKQLWHAIAKCVVGFFLVGAYALKYASPPTFAEAIVVGGIVLLAQGIAELSIEGYYYLKGNPKP